MSFICTNIGCTKLFRTGQDMLMHQQLDCPMRRIMCEHGCGVFMPFQNLDAHMRVYAMRARCSVTSHRSSLTGCNFLAALLLRLRLLLI